MGGDISVLTQEWGGYVSKSSLVGEYFTERWVKGASCALKPTKTEKLIDNENEYQ
jgi:hypothetical protein